MKSFISFFFGIILTLSAAPVFAGGLGDIIDIINGGSNNNGGGNWAGGYSCRSYDDGWEEHWGGHSDCGSCLAQHGGCIEKCTQSYSVCQAQGTDYNGNTYTFRGSAPSRWQAEDQAMNQCQWQLRNCRIVGCDNQEEVVSQRSCYR